MKFLADIVEPAVFITYNVATFPSRILNHHGGLRMKKKKKKTSCWCVS